GAEGAEWIAGVGERGLGEGPVGERAKVVVAVRTAVGQRARRDRRQVARLVARRLPLRIDLFGELAEGGDHGGSTFQWNYGKSLLMEQRTDVAECRSGPTAFRMIVSNKTEHDRVATLATKEPETVRWIAEHFGAGDTLFDIGANIGIFAILAAAQNRNGTVVAVEPMAATFARLCDNALLNSLANLRPYCVAIGAEN